MYEDTILEDFMDTQKGKPVTILCMNQRELQQMRRAYPEAEIYTVDQQSAGLRITGCLVVKGMSRFTPEQTKKVEMAWKTRMAPGCQFVRVN